MNHFQRTMAHVQCVTLSKNTGDLRIFKKRLENDIDDCMYGVLQEVLGKIRTFKESRQLIKKLYIVGFYNFYVDDLQDAAMFNTQVIAALIDTPDLVKKPLKLIDAMLDLIEEINGASTEQFFAWELVECFTFFVDLAHKAASEDAYQKNLQRLATWRQEVLDSIDHSKTNLVEVST